MRTRARAAAAALTTIAATGGLTFGLVGAAAAEDAPPPVVIVEDSAIIFGLGGSSLHNGDPCGQVQLSRIDATSPAATIQFGGGFTDCGGGHIGLGGSTAATVAGGSDGMVVTAELPGTSFDPNTGQSTQVTVAFAATWTPAGDPVTVRSTTKTIDAAGCRVTTDQTISTRPATATGTATALGLTVAFTAPKVRIPNVSDASLIHTVTATTTRCSPESREDCKSGGRSSYTVPRSFKNQGDCVQFVNTGR